MYYLLKQRNILVPSDVQNWWGNWEPDLLSSKVISGPTVWQLASLPSWYLYQRQAHDSTTTEYVLHNMSVSGSIGRRLKVLIEGIQGYGYFHPYPVISDTPRFGYLKTTHSNPRYLWVATYGTSTWPVITVGTSLGTRYNYDNTSDDFYFKSGGVWKKPVQSATGGYISANVSITAEEDDAYKLTHGSFPIGVYKNRNNKEALVGFIGFSLKLNGSAPYNVNSVMTNYVQYNEERIILPESQVASFMARTSTPLNLYMDLTDYYIGGRFKTSYEYRIYETDLSYWKYTGILPYNSDMSNVTFTRVWAGSGDDPYPFSITLSFSEYRAYIGTKTAARLIAFLPTIYNGHWQ